MTTLELIDRLCSIVEEQSRIIKDQAFYMEQINGVNESDLTRFAEVRNATATRLKELEVEMRPFHITFVQEGE